MCSEWIAPSRRSKSSAFSFNSSTAARLNVQTLIGSYVALSTSTRAILLANTTQALLRDRIRAQNPDRPGLPAQRLEGIGDDGIAERPFEIAEEHVATQAAPQRPRLDSGQVDAATRELLQRLDQCPGVIRTQLGEDERGTRRPLANRF